jgi:hypothetical protein
MAKTGLRHIDVGPELTKTEWESEESHELVHGTSFPASPVERQLFYRDDEHKWYIYDGTEWVDLQGGGVELHGNEYHDPDFASEAALAAHEATTTGVHGLKGVVGFSAYQTSDQTIAKDTEVVINWHAEEWDIGGYFDLSTEKFTPLVAGKYLFLLGVQLKSLSADEDLMLFIAKNGGWDRMVARVNAGAASHLQVSGTVIMEANGSTDYFQASVMHYDSVDRDTYGALGRVFWQAYLLPQL